MAWWPGRLEQMAADWQEWQNRGVAVYGGRGIRGTGDGAVLLYARWGKNDRSTRMIWGYEDSGSRKVGVADLGENYLD